MMGNQAAHCLLVDSAHHRIARRPPEAPKCLQGDGFPESPEEE